MSAFLSACCGAPVGIAPGGGVTHYHVCQNCGQPCDVVAELGPSPLDALPVCLGCYRERVGLDSELPPPPADWPEERCTVCAHRTNHGLYLLRGVGATDAG